MVFHLSAESGYISSQKVNPAWDHQFGMNYVEQSNMNNDHPIIEDGVAITMMLNSYIAMVSPVDKKALVSLKRIQNMSNLFQRVFAALYQPDRSFPNTN